MNWHLKKIAVSDLKEWEWNPRQLTKSGIEKLTESITKFGVAEPLVLNTDLTICGGHGRKKVLEQLGIEKVDCYLPERELDKKEFEELNIRLNKNIAGQWDHEKLSNFFNITELKEWGFKDWELGLNMPEVEEEQEEESQERTCPNCGHHF